MFRKFKKYIHALKDHGFSLAEGVAAAGILGVVSLALLQGMKQNAINSQTARIEDTIQQVVEAAAGGVKDAQSCGAIVNGINVNTALPMSFASTTLLGAGGQPISVMVSRTNGGEVSKQLTNNMILIEFGSAGTDARLRFVSAGLSNFKRKFAQTYSGLPGSGVQEIHGTVDFDLYFRKMVRPPSSSTPAAYRNITRKVTIDVATRATGEVIRCLSDGDKVAETLKEDVCAKDFSGQPMGSYSTGDCMGYKNSAAHTIARDVCAEIGGAYDSATDTCQQSHVVSCFNGTLGFNADGSPICAPAP